MYGALMAVAGALVTFGLYFTGFHDTAEKLAIGQPIGTVLGILITVGGMVLAMRERRVEYPGDQAWSYGSAFSTAFLAGLVAVVLGCIVNYIYTTFVNPQFTAVVAQMRTAAMERHGASSAQIEQQTALLHKPVLMIVFQLIGGTFIIAVIALIVAIFFRKPRAEPPVVDLPAAP